MLPILPVRPPRSARDPKPSPRPRGWPTGGIYATTGKSSCRGRGTQRAPALAIKFSLRRNIRSWCILLRPCLCNEGSMAANTLYPVHMIWPCIRRWDGAGGPSVPRCGRRHVQPTTHGHYGRLAIRPRRAVFATRLQAWGDKGNKKPRRRHREHTGVRNVNICLL